MLFLPELAINPKVLCFTTSQQGGVSNGVYKSFNLGDHVGDNNDRVAINRQLLSAILTQQVINRKIDADTSDLIEIAPIKWLKQGHSSNIMTYDEVTESVYEDKQTDYIDGIDTLITNVPLVLMTADCLPIVLACGKTGRIAAVHAGWRGLVDGFLAKVLTRFEDTSAVSVWIGPHISQEHFHISDDIIDFFKPYAEAIQVSTEPGKYQVDLANIACGQLNAAGVSNIQVSPICTYTNEYCFSHRKSTHNGQAQTGRMATVIIRL